jgi:hypothetical protein
MNGHAAVVFPTVRAVDPVVAERLFLQLTLFVLKTHADTCLAEAWKSPLDCVITIVLRR